MCVFKYHAFIFCIRPPRWRRETFMPFSQAYIFPCNFRSEFLSSFYTLCVDWIGWRHCWKSFHGHKVFVRFFLWQIIGIMSTISPQFSASKFSSGMCLTVAVVSPVLAHSWFAVYGPQQSVCGGDCQSIADLTKMSLLGMKRLFCTAQEPQCCKAWSLYQLPLHLESCQTGFVELLGSFSQLWPKIRLYHRQLEYPSPEVSMCQTAPLFSW